MDKRKNFWHIEAMTKGNKPSAQSKGSMGLFRNADNIWTVFTIENLKFLNQTVVPMVRLCHPIFSRVHFSSQDLRRILEEMEDQTGAHILAKKAISYSHRKESNISYRKKPYWQIFETAATEDEYVDKVEFSAQMADGLHAYVSRDGVGKFYSGKFGQMQQLLRSMTNVASHTRTFFSERIRKAKSTEIYPIDLEFTQDVFRKPEDNSAFLSRLSRLSRSGLAVIHSNPYLHISFVDFYDGSAFDIFATSAKSVTIIPQVHSSPFAVSRLCNHIFEHFHEGTIAGAIPKTYGMADFVR